MWAGLSSDLIIEQVLMRSMKTSGGLTRGRGMSEQQRILWLLSMPACAEVNKSMQEFTGVHFNTGEQNKDMSKARQERDWTDTQTVLHYLHDRNPFGGDPVLRNIHTGVHANRTVNVDTAKAIGDVILNSMVGKTAAEYSFKKKDEAVTLATKSSINIDGNKVNIDPQLLFQRLITAARSLTDLSSAFKYELCSYPPALFDSSLMMREPHKPALADAIWTLLPKQDIFELHLDAHYVLDGGALLQRIPWSRGATFQNICSQYTDYVTRKYGKATIVFDGYETTSTKDMTHQRRSNGKAGKTVTFTADMNLTMTKDTFLANQKNKQRFINMVSEELRKNNCIVYHASSDADLLIVQEAVKSAQCIDTVLVGDDTDLLVLLCYHGNLDSHDLYFRPEPKKNSKNPRLWNVKFVKKHLGPDICNNILFIHAVLGCDTTSRLYGIGKGISLNKFKTSSHFVQQAKVFDVQSMSADDVVTVGEKALVIIYNGKPTDTLDSLRYQRFCEKVASSISHIQPQSLPPTSAAAKHHSLRVYLQVHQWKGSGNELNPKEWGWRQNDDGLFPFMTDSPPAPAELLRVISCNCQTDCSSLRCSCKKHDVECTPACGNCRGTGFSNTAHLTSDDEDEDDCEF